MMVHEDRIENGGKPPSRLLLCRPLLLVDQPIPWTTTTPGRARAIPPLVAPGTEDEDPERDPSARETPVRRQGASVVRV